LKKGSQVINLKLGGGKMKKRRILLLITSALIVFMVGLGGCANVPKAFKGVTPKYTGLGEYEVSEGWSFTVYKKETPNLNVPVIKAACAIDQGLYGTTILKIYLDAEDPNGDMAKIATTVDQVAYGHYPTDFIFLKPEHGKYFKGYIEWNTWSMNASSMPDGNYVTVRVAVIDKAGNASNEFVFRFTFQTGVLPAPNPPEPFDQGNLSMLGHVFINLFNPYHMGGGGGNFR
jgi:hypothetical protein